MTSHWWLELTCAPAKTVERYLDNYEARRFEVPARNFNRHLYQNKNKHTKNNKIQQQQPKKGGWVGVGAVDEGLEDGGSGDGGGRGDLRENHVLLCH